MRIDRVGVETQLGYLGWLWVDQVVSAIGGLPYQTAQWTAD